MSISCGCLSPYSEDKIKKGGEFYEKDADKTTSRRGFFQVLSPTKKIKLDYIVILIYNNITNTVTVAMRNSKEITLTYRHDGEKIFKECLIMKKYFNNCEVKDFSEKINVDEMDITITITGAWGVYEENHEIIIDCKVDNYEDFEEVIKSCAEEFTEIYSISVTTNK